MNTPDSSIDEELERHKLRTLEIALSRVTKDYVTRISKLESVQEKKLSQLSKRIAKLESTRQEWQFPSSTEWGGILGFLFGCLAVSVLAMALM
jgi:hypothetical protein